MASHAETHTTKWGSEIAAGEERTRQDVPVVDPERRPQTVASTGRENAGQGVWARKRAEALSEVSEAPPSFASAMSFVGCTRRVSAWAERHDERGSSYHVALWAGVFLALLFMYTFVSAWYMFLIVTTLFFLSIPLLWPFAPAMLGFFGFRSARRSQRKAQYTNEQQLAVMKQIAEERRNPPAGERREGA